MDHSRIVCWIAAGDAASIVAAKLAIRENAQEANPLPVVVATHRFIGVDALEQAARHLDMPVTLLSSVQFLTFDMPGDVHVWGIAADEQQTHEEIQSVFPSRAVASVLADRALRRADCIELVRRDGALTAFLPVHPAMQLLRRAA